MVERLTSQLEKTVVKEYCFGKDIHSPVWDSMCSRDVPVEDLHSLDIVLKFIEGDY